MSAAAERFDVGGTPQQNAAVAVLMFAIMATDHVAAEERLVDQASASSLAIDVLLEANRGGFASGEEFCALVDVGQLTPRLEQLAMHIVYFAGGPAKIFDMLSMAVTPAGSMGVAQ